MTTIYAAVQCMLKNVTLNGRDAIVPIVWSLTETCATLGWDRGKLELIQTEKLPGDFSQWNSKVFLYSSLLYYLDKVHWHQWWQSLVMAHGYILIIFAHHSQPKRSRQWENINRSDLLLITCGLSENVGWNHVNSWRIYSPCCMNQTGSRQGQAREFVIWTEVI